MKATPVGKLKTIVLALAPSDIKATAAKAATEHANLNFIFLPLLTMNWSGKTTIKQFAAQFDSA
jgi:hypothetical protein